MTTDLAAAQAARAGAEVVVSEAELAAAYNRMARALSARLGDDDVLVLPVMIGGFIPATELLQRMPEAVEVDYLHATRYRGQTSGSGLAWLHRPATSMRGRRVLLVDDILDEGHTLKAITRWCENQDATDIRVAVLAVKDHDRCVEGIEADYVGVEVPDRYVFGFGMDYHEQGRNLPAIYALAD